ncbi:MAG: family 1 glycosylhydrolase, partial [Verrucomicrobiaceae bacterium]|nr:family 1 glycosylhydrolase [Verrucomicrobiaceae bacterium]
MQPEPGDQEADFLWGVATSAYQAEGGYNQPGQPRTNWAEAEERGDVALSGEAAGFWQRYSEDFARCRALGLNAFRLGIEWSRCHELDPAAIDHYASILRACRTHGLEPVVTLHHFVHPARLGPDPWLESSAPELFAGYVRELVARINAQLARPIRWFITINEPNMLVLNSYLGRQFPAQARPGFDTIVRAYNQLLRAHILAYRALHELYAERGWVPPRVTFNNYCSDIY